MRRTPLHLLATCALFAAPAWADKEAPPPPGPAEAFRLPTPSEYQLPNGLRVTLVPYGAVPKANVSLVLQAGNIDTPSGQSGLPELVGKLLQEGTSTLSAEQLAQAASDLGGALEVDVGADESSVEIECLGEATAKAVGLVAQVISQPALPESEVPRLKTDMVRELSIARSRQQPLAREAFAQVLYGSAHPYGRELAEPAEVQKLTLAEAKRFLSTFVGANRAHLYVVGRYDEAAVREAVQSAFGGWAPAPGAKRPAARPKSARAVYLLDRPGAVQSTVLLGLPVVPPSSPDYIPLSVANTLLGGSFGSRITANIREKHGYTYSPFSALTAHPSVASWAEAADVTSKDTAAAVQEVLNEVKLLRKTPPTPEELAGFQRYMSGTFVLRNSARPGIISQLRFVELFGLPAAWLSSYVSKVNAVTPAEVTRVVKKYLDPAKMALVVVGDRQLVGPTLAQFGHVTVLKPRPAAPP